jgi:hypothetical protein
MEINLPTRFIPQHEACRKSWLERGVVVESVFGQRLLRILEIVAFNGEIEIFMLTSLLADECVDAPSSVHADIDASSFRQSSTSMTSAAVIAIRNDQAGSRRRSSSASAI